MGKAPITLMTVEGMHRRMSDYFDHAIFVVRKDLAAEHVPKIEKI